MKAALERAKQGATRNLRRRRAAENNRLLDITDEKSFKTYLIYPKEFDAVVSPRFSNL